MKIHSRLTLTCLLAFGGQLGAMAQTAAPAPTDQSTTTTTTTTTTPTALPASNGPAVAEQTVELSPFEVNSTKDNGYAATETLAGTRIATNLADVAASISVYNKDFLSDINATNAQTLLQYTTNGEVAGPYGSYTGLGNGQSVNESTNLINPEAAQRIRGLAAADNARNYFITDIPWDSYNTDRIDVLRGPNSILYGLGSPAGIINGTTNTADFIDEGSVDLSTDSYGSFRSTLDLNQQLIPGVLAIRLDVENGDQKFEQQQAFSDDNRYYGAIRFDPQLFKKRDF
jgi:outer membrane receptor protein involved in Fe transport